MDSRLKLTQRVIITPPKVQLPDIHLQYEMNSPAKLSDSGLTNDLRFEQ